MKISLNHTLLIITFLAGCGGGGGGGSDSNPMPTITLITAAQANIPSAGAGVPYNVNLASGVYPWAAVLSDNPVPYASGEGIVSSGPWFIDVNHRESGMIVGPLTIYSASLNSVPDLIGAKIKIRLKLDYVSWYGEQMVPGDKLVFRFSANLRKGVAGGNYALPERHVVYTFNVDILPHALADQSIEISLTDSMDDWSCLGRNQIDTRDMIGSAAKYTCALNREELREAMRNPESMGILYLFSRDINGVERAILNESNPYRTQTMGATTFTLREFMIIK